LKGVSVIKIAVFASGNGSNLQALIDAQDAGSFKGKISLVFSNVPGSKALERGENERIESIAQMELQKIYVLQEHHGAGIGTALLNEIKNLADKFCPDYVWLDTHISNENAIRLYEKSGFNKIGKYFFTIGSQTFEYHVMGLPVACKVTHTY